jgi:phage shock protein A
VTQEITKPADMPVEEWLEYAQESYRVARRALASIIHAHDEIKEQIEELRQAERDLERQRHDAFQVAAGWAYTAQVAEHLAAGEPESVAKQMR